MIFDMISADTISSHLNPTAKAENQTNLNGFLNHVTRDSMLV